VELCSVQKCTIEANKKTRILNTKPTIPDDTVITKKDNMTLSK
jgi:hypothetical protein